MLIELRRFALLQAATLGLVYLDGRFCCFSLEDQVQPAGKVIAESCIPAGHYDVKLQTEGRVHADYLKRYADIHKGVLAIQDVPGFSGVLLHVGNTTKDTAGCVLVGDGILASGELVQSVAGYRRLYVEVLGALSFGDPVSIQITE